MRKFHAIFRPQLDLVKNQLTLNYEHETPLTVNLNEDTDFKSSNRKEAKMCTTKICKDVVSGHDLGLEATEWLERVTGLLDLRLVRVNDRSSEVKSAANDAQFLILNLASVELLKQKAFFVHCYLLPHFFLLCAIFVGNRCVHKNAGLNASVKILHKNNIFFK